MLFKKIICHLLIGSSPLLAAPVFAGNCDGLPSHAELKATLTEARKAENGGFGNEVWGTVVNRDGVICAVAYSGSSRGAQWPASRVDSAQKAYTANGYSLPALALATANLHNATQTGGILFGQQLANPADMTTAYAGDATKFGMSNDPLTGKRIGGINVQGGGLALYNAEGKLLGAVGISGDTSCASHFLAWRTRHFMKLDYVPSGMIGGVDQISFEGAWGQPHCKDAAAENAVLKTLPATSKKTAR